MEKQTQAYEGSRAERVWNLLAGEYDLDVYVPPEAKHVRGEWEDNAECAALWQAIYDACERIAQRLGSGGEDPDLRAVVEGYERLMKISGLKMFEYGVTLPRAAAEREGPRRGRE